jgi:hypothetical protein
MGQINPFRGIVVPSALPQKVQPQKDREQRRQQREEARDSEEEQSDKPPEDGKPHVDLKA